MSSQREIECSLANVGPASSVSGGGHREKRETKKFHYEPSPINGHFRRPSQLSSLNFVAARPYRRRQTRRLIVTTIAAMTTVAASSTRKFPLSVA